MTSSVVRPGPTGWRARIMFGSTNPSAYPWMSSAKQLAFRRSLSIARSRKGILLAANLTACSVCFSPSMAATPLACFGHAILRSCGFCPFSVGNVASPACWKPCEERRSATACINDACKAFMRTVSHQYLHRATWCSVFIEFRTFLGCMKKLRQDGSEPVCSTRRTPFPAWP